MWHSVRTPPSLVRAAQVAGVLGLAVAGCAPAPVAVSAVQGMPAAARAPFAVAALADPAIVALLTARGLVSATATSPYVLDATLTARPTGTGVCRTIAAPCADWLAVPKRGWQPLGRTTAYRLVLRLARVTGATVASATATTVRRGTPGPALTGALLDAAVARGFTPTPG